MCRLIGYQYIVAIGKTSSEWRLQAWDLAAIIQSGDSDVSGKNWNPSTSAKLWNLPITNTDKGNKVYKRMAADEYHKVAICHWKVRIHLCFVHPLKKNNGNKLSSIVLLSGCSKIGGFALFSAHFKWQKATVEVYAFFDVSSYVKNEHGHTAFMVRCSFIQIILYLSTEAIEHNALYL